MYYCALVLAHKLFIFENGKLRFYGWLCIHMFDMDDNQRIQDTFKAASIVDVQRWENGREKHCTILSSS